MTIRAAMYTDIVTLLPNLNTYMYQSKLRFVPRLRTPLFRWAFRGKFRAVPRLFRAPTARGCWSGLGYVLVEGRISGALGFRGGGG